MRRASRFWREQFPRGQRALSGVTLLELVITIVIMGLLAGMSLFVAGRTRNIHNPDDALAARLRLRVADARRRALRTGSPVTERITDDMKIDSTGRRQTTTYIVTAFPDGSVFTEPRPFGPILIDALSGSGRSEVRDVAP